MHYFILGFVTLVLMSYTLVQRRPRFCNSDLHVYATRRDTKLLSLTEC